MTKEQLQLGPHNDQIGQLAELGKKLAEWMETAKVYRNCLTCGYFIEQMELCEKFKGRPPAKIIAYGCEEHSQTIPF